MDRTSDFAKENCVNHNLIAEIRGKRNTAQLWIRIDFGLESDVPPGVWCYNPWGQLIYQLSESRIFLVGFNSLTEWWRTQKKRSIKHPLPSLPHLFHLGTDPSFSPSEQRSLPSRKGKPFFREAFPTQKIRACVASNVA